MADLQKTQSPTPFEVEQMFDSIAHRYDLLNRILSLGIDIHWRKKLVDMLSPRPGQCILDLATGSGDILKTFLRRVPVQGIGCDRSENMLRFADKKFKKFGFHPALIRADAFRLPLRNDSIDLLTIGFGLRNMNPRLDALREIYRIIKPSGRLAVLEFFPNQRGIRGSAYKWYAKNIIPFVGRIISGDSFAYKYLPDSIDGFPDSGSLIKELETVGFADNEAHPITFGIVSIVIGTKPLS